MADRSEAMLRFYEECQNKGCTDMQDDTQSLKAKDIAADLGLKYDDIETLFDEAEKIKEEKDKLNGFQSEKEQASHSGLYRRGIPRMGMGIYEGPGGGSGPVRQNPAV